MRDVMFQLLSSAVLAWASVSSCSSLLCREWLAHRIRKTKTMKENSGYSNSSLSKGKQIRNCEGTWSTDAIVSLVNYTGMMA